MGTGERKTSAEQGLAEKVAHKLVDRIRENELTIVSEICFRETPGDRPILLILNSPLGERIPGSGTVQEMEYRALLRIRAEIAGRLQEGSADVRLLYASLFISLPDGQEVVAGLTEDYQRIPIAEKD